MVDQALRTVAIRPKAVSLEAEIAPSRDPP